MEQLAARVRDALPGRGAGAALWHVPGRVEVLGKHTDYAGGRSLLATVARGLVLGMTPRSDAVVTFVDTSTGARARFDLDPQLVPLTGRWAGYPMTVARRLARNFPAARRGADLALASDLPSAAGMSSSSAMIVATFLALAEANALADTAAWREHLATSEALAGYLGCIENGQDFGPLAGEMGVGTFGGSEDHTAIICCREGTLRRYAFCPVTFEAEVPWPASMTFAIAVSGVRARKTGPERAAYNRLSLATREILRRWASASGRAVPSLAAAVEAAGLEAVLHAIGQDEADSEFPPGFLAARLRQFVTESFEIIPAASEALAGGNLAEFGRQVARSQQGAEEGLGNQVPETIALASLARDLGAHAASAFGAGFGGSVWAMVEEHRAADFLHEWLSRYTREFHRAAARADGFLSRPSAAARRID